MQSWARSPLSRWSLALLAVACKPSPPPASVILDVSSNCGSSRTGAVDQTTANPASPPEVSPQTDTFETQEDLGWYDQSTAQQDMPGTSDQSEMVSMFSADQTFGQESPQQFALNGDPCPTEAPPPLTPAQEESLIRNAYDYATKKVKEEQTGLGNGWLGNVSGCGPKCNVVHDAYEPHVRRYLNENLQGQKLKYYTPVTVFDSGSLPADLSAHVYMGIGTVPQKVGEKSQLKSWIDPWRYGDATQYKPGTGPNSPDQVIPNY